MAQYDAIYSTGMCVESGGASHRVQVELFDAAVRGAAEEGLVVLA